MTSPDERPGPDAPDGSVPSDRAPYGPDAGHDDGRDAGPTADELFSWRAPGTSPTFADGGPRPPLGAARHAPSHTRGLPLDRSALARAEGAQGPGLGDVGGPGGRAVRRPSGPVGVLSPSRADPIVRLASQVIGGPAGRRVASATGFWRAASVLVIFVVVTMSLALVERQHCRNEGWSSDDMFFHMCYSDIGVIYGKVPLAGEGRPGLVEAVAVDGPVDQPPLMSALMWVVAGLVPSPDDPAAARTYLDISTVLLGAGLVVAVGFVASVAGRRRWDAAHLALGPVVVTSGLVSYDLFAVTLGCAALWAWSRHRVVAAGLLLGLAVAVRPTWSILAVVLLALALRAGVLMRASTAIAVGAAAYVGLRVVLLPGWTGHLGTSFVGWRDERIGYGSLLLVPQLLGQSKPANARVWYTGDGLGATSGTVLSLVGLTVVVITVLGLALATWRRPRVAHLALVAVVGCFLVAKSVPVQASVLLLPLVALAGLRWRDHLVWAGTEIVYFVVVWLYIAGQTNADRGVPSGFYLLVMLARIAGHVWLAVQATRAMLDPVRDPVRVPEDDGPGADDPLGGPMADVPDALVVRIV